MQTLATIGSGISGPGAARLDKGLLAGQASASLCLLSLGGTAAGPHLFQEVCG